MSRGKDICKELKAVRRRIAEENDIPLEIKECSYKGECRGTCPRCEAEVRYLEGELTERLRRGKVATVAGLTLGLSLCANAQSEVPTIEIGTPIDTSHHQVVGKGCLKGIVIDGKTEEPLPFVNVILKRDGKQVRAGMTDFDGIYTLKPLPAGEYTLEVSAVGYNSFVREGIVVKAAGFTVCDITLGHDSKVLDAVEIKGERGDYDDHAVIGGIEPVKLPGTPASESGDKVPQRVDPSCFPDPVITIGGVGYQGLDGSPGTVQVQRVGPYLMVVEPDEPEL